VPVNTSVNNRFFNQPVVTTAVNYTALISDVIIEVSSTAAILTITLPAPSALGNVGKSFIIKDTSGGAQTNNIFIAPASGLIDGMSSLAIASNYGSAQVFCDGSNYYSFGSRTSGSFIVNERVFTTSGTYTPTAGMLYCEVEILGGGGAGGGALATTVAQNSLGTGGGGGEYAFGVFSSAQIGASQTVTIGAGGTANSGAAGGTGGTTSLGSLMTALGGAGGTTTTAGPNASAGGAVGGTGGTGGSFRNAGAQGGGVSAVFGSVALASIGGNSIYGAGGTAVPTGNSSSGTAGLGYGSGGSGGTNYGTASANSGGAGAPGGVFITEYIATSAASMPVVALAKASWTRQSTTQFTPGATVVEINFSSDAGSVPSGTASRIDLSALTQNENSGLTISQFQAAVTQGGTYQIVGNTSMLVSSVPQNGVLQCVKNGSTVLAMGAAQTQSQSAIETASFIVTAEFAVGDTIDFRVNSQQSGGFSFWAISLAITQLPSSTIIPLTQWNPVAATSQLMAPNGRYYAQSATLTTFTLPVAAAAGTELQICGLGAGGWKLAQNAGQSINVGNQVTTTGTGGSIASINRYDGLWLLCVVADTQWVATGGVGNLTLV